MSISVSSEATSQVLNTLREFGEEGSIHARWMETCIIKHRMSKSKFNRAIKLLLEEGYIDQLGYGQGVPYISTHSRPYKREALGQYARSRYALDNGFHPVGAKMFSDRIARELVSLETKYPVIHNLEVWKIILNTIEERVSEIRKKVDTESNIWQD